MNACCTFDNLPSLGQAFDGRDFVSLGLDGEFLAGINRRPIQQHRAGAARRAVTTFLGAGQAGIIPQGVEQGHARFELKFHFLAVDLQRHRHRAGAENSLGVDLFQFRGHRRGLRGHRRHRRGAQSFQKCPAGKGTRAGCVRIIHNFPKWDFTAFS